ncbi:hypothetical protein B0H13DRAFT_1911322 [Mycena leptocephala]|nr:hypothetical protein B0H13DRAFT_1911322 [Mycena leptocephala]
MDIDNASDDDQPQCDCSSDDENKPPLPISQIDAETDELAHCDMCRTQLGPRAADIDTRAFRCFNCELSVQCETCCSQAHLNFAGHTVQEWSNISREWGEKHEMCEVLSPLTKMCSGCNIELAAQGMK